MLKAKLPWFNSVSQTASFEYIMMSLDTSDALGFIFLVSCGCYLTVIGNDPHAAGLVHCQWARMKCISSPSTEPANLAEYIVSYGNNIPNSCLAGLRQAFILKINVFIHRFSRCQISYVRS